jgi:hypothetical protein
MQLYFWRQARIGADVNRIAVNSRYLLSENRWSEQRVVFELKEGGKVQNGRPDYLISG